MQRTQISKTNFFTNWSRSLFSHYRTELANSFTVEQKTVQIMQPQDQWIIWRLTIEVTTSESEPVSASSFVSTRFRTIRFNALTPTMLTTTTANHLQPKSTAAKPNTFFHGRQTPENTSICESGAALLLMFFHVGHLPSNKSFDFYWSLHTPCFMTAVVPISIVRVI